MGIEGLKLQLRCSVVAFGCIVLTMSAAAQQTKSAADDIEEIVVTGSLIKRTDTETPSAVQIITAQDLIQSGYNNVADVLRNLPANGQGALSQSFHAFASGGSGIALRGLTVGDTLVLIDGVRQVAYPIQDDNERSFVDISAIPLNAVESIEIVKDSASAVYGADAIAGVVNVKLKKNYIGAELTAEAGTSKHGDGTTEHVAGIFGLGDLPNDGYNIYVAVDWHHTDQITIADRAGEGFANTDWSGLPYGLNAAFGSAPNAITNFPYSTTGYILNPATYPPSNLGPGNAAFLSGCTYAKLNSNQCQFDYPGQIQPASEQRNLLAKFTKALPSDWTLVITGSVFDSIAQQEAFYSGIGQNQLGGITDYAYSPGSFVSPVVSPTITVPANYPGNPYGAPAALLYSFPDVQTTDIETLTYRLYNELKGNAFGWDIDANLGVMYSRAQEHNFGYIEPALFQAALNSGQYIIGQTSLGTGARLFAPQFLEEPTSSLDVVDLHASRLLLESPLGASLAMATGVQYFYRTEKDLQPPSVANGQYFESDGAYNQGNSSDMAAFLEFDGHPVKQFEIDASGRYDHYNTIGGDFTPKIGVKFKPVDMFAIRSTWGKGFRAPSSAEGQSSGTAFGAGTFQDPLLCPNGPNVKGAFNYACEYPLEGFIANGTNLKPVTSTNATFGVVFEPLKSVNMSVNYYQIKLANDIIPSFELNGGLSNYSTLQRGPSQPLAECTNTVTTGTCTQTTVNTPVGTIADAVYPYVNASSTKTQGLDVDLKGQFDLGTGTVSVEVNYTHVFEYDITAGGQTYSLSGTHGPSGISGDTGNPRDRATLSLGWASGPGSITVNENWTGPFNLTDPSAGIDNCVEALNSSEATYAPRFNGVTQAAVPSQYCTVRSFIETNVYASYSIGAHLSLHGSITNLFDRQPPIDLQTYGGGGGLAYDGAFHQDGAIGRFFTAGATYKF